MKIFAVTIEDMATFFMTKDEARRFNRRHDEPGEIEEISKVEAVALLNSLEAATNIAPESNPVK